MQNFNLQVYRTGVAVGVVLWAHSPRASKGIAYLIDTVYSMNKDNFEKRPECEYFH